MQIKPIELASLSDQRRAAILRRSELDITSYMDKVRPIIDDVQRDGDAALAKYSARFDGVDEATYSPIASQDELEEAAASLDPELKAAMTLAAENIQRYHEEQLPKEMWMLEIRPGVLAGEKISPITSVGLYVPRGKGSFPSVMLMLGIPAKVAKVPSICVVTPPTAEGKVDAASAYAAKLCGIDRVYKVGGAQAIAALAYGTESIPRTLKVLGPGNAYVSAAKRLLYGKLDVGVPAGPSESIILCDGSTDPEMAAVDLLIEAEHGPDSAALLVTDSRAVADAVCAKLPALIDELPEPRKQFCTHVFSNYGGVLLTESLDQSIDFVNEFAPEHLEVLTEQPFEVLPRLVNAGEILLGPHAPISLGNFSLGVNAILPTGGFARTFSCVTVFDYLKRTSIGHVTKAGFDQIGPAARTLAQYEGFPSHDRALRFRQEKS